MTFDAWWKSYEAYHGPLNVPTPEGIARDAWNAATGGGEAAPESKDAARYRWLKSLMKEDAEGWTFPGIAGAPSIETVDQVIDATIASYVTSPVEGK